MIGALNNIATTDRYTTANTLACPGAQRINLDVYNAGVYYQLGHGIGQPLWDEEVFLGPAFRSMDPVGDDAAVADAVRVRSAATGTPARVTIHAR